MPAPLNTYCSLNRSFERRRSAFRGAEEELCMYELLVATAFAATVFVPSFIGIRARTEAQADATRQRR
jgi:hypothetical protein